MKILGRTDLMTKRETHIPTSLEGVTEMSDLEMPAIPDITEGTRLQVQHTANPNNANSLFCTGMNPEHKIFYRFLLNTENGAMQLEKYEPGLRPQMALVQRVIVSREDGEFIADPGIIVSNQDAVQFLQKGLTQQWVMPDTNPQVQMVAAHVWCDMGRGEGFKGYQIQPQLYGSSSAAPIAKN